ncbi:MAG: SLBB domain-containing protein [Victivallales bacterium]|nr:SLBB domain-containing protein [Victivallales bacterium]
MKKIIASLFLVLLSVFLTSCNTFYDFDDPYYSLPEASTEMLEISLYTPEQLAQRANELAQINKQKYPEYTLDIGDEFEIRVYNQPDLHATTAVTPDGCISTVFVDKLSVVGKTIPETTTMMEDILKQYIINPKVTMIPLDLKSQKASIAGAVVHPGVYPVSKNTRLSEIFAMAGGGATRWINGKQLDCADFTFSYLVRDGKQLPVNFSLAIEYGDPDNNIFILKGDYIYIAIRSEKMVNITGEVASPQFQMWNSGMGLLQAITNAGGLREQNNGYAVIIRGGMENPQFFKADINKIFDGRKLDVPLHPGDTVYIPKDGLSVWNTYIAKLMPTASFINMLISPYHWYKEITR